MLECLSIYRGLSWAGGAWDLLSLPEMAAFVAFMMAVGYLSGAKFTVNAQFYVPILTLVMVLTLIHGLIDVMEIRAFIRGDGLCFGDTERPGQIPPPQSPDWMAEMLKVSVAGVAIILVPFVLGKRRSKFANGQAK